MTSDQPAMDRPDELCLLESLPSSYRELVAHMCELGEMEVLEKGGQHYVAWDALCHYVPPHP